MKDYKLKLALSSCGRWMQCAASEPLLRKLKEDGLRDDSKVAKFAEMGTNQHKDIEEVGLKAIEGDVKLFDSNLYWRNLQILLGSPLTDYQIETEKRLQTRLFIGTSDAVLKRSRELVIVDWKTGAMPVKLGSVDKPNLQVALAAMAELANYSTEELGGLKIRLAIVAPNCYLEEYQYQLLELTVEELKLAVKPAQERAILINTAEPNNLDFAAGEYCKHCKASIHCPRLSQSWEAVETLRRAGTRIDALPAKALEDIITAGGIIDQFVELCKDKLKERPAADMVDYKKSSRVGAIEWTSPETVVKWAIDNQREDILTVAKPSDCKALLDPVFFESVTQRKDSISVLKWAGSTTKGQKGAEILDAMILPSN